jgi:hypothetical protein
MSFDQPRVGFDGVHAHADELGVALGELIFPPGEIAQLGGAHGGEVGWVGEENASPITEVLVQADLPLSGLGGEVGGSVAQLDRHQGGPGTYF